MINATKSDLKSIFLLLTSIEWCKGVPYENNCNIDIKAALISSPGQFHPSQTGTTLTVTEGGMNTLKLAADDF
jgi:hypothetical protein